MSACVMLLCKKLIKIVKITNINEYKLARNSDQTVTVPKLGLINKYNLISVYILINYDYCFILIRLQITIKKYC